MWWTRFRSQVDSSIWWARRFRRFFHVDSSISGNARILKSFGDSQHEDDASGSEDVISYKHFGFVVLKVVKSVSRLYKINLWTFIESIRATV